jgi:mono/diheme cytochrome c family protein
MSNSYSRSFPGNPSAKHLPVIERRILMKTLPVLIALVAVLIYAMPMTAADAGAGKDLYAKKCANCHGAAGEGKEAIAKMFKVEMKPLNSKEAQARSDGEIKKIILEGTGKMTAVKDVDAKAADDAVAFVRTLAKK